MQNFGGIQQNMTYMMQQMGSGQEFPVPITANQNVPTQPRKQRNNKKFLAPQTLPQQQQQLRMLQQPQQLQQFPQQPPPPPQQPPPPQIQQIESMGQITPGPIAPTPIAQQQRKNQPIRQIPQVMKAQPPQQQQKIDRDSFFLLSESLCSFSWMDSVETDWIGDKMNPEIVQIINNVDDSETNLDFNSVADYINASNYLFHQK